MNKRLFLSLCLLLVLGFVAFFGIKEQGGKKRELIKELTPLPCDLNLQACEYEFKGRKVRVEFKEKPIQALIENELLVENLGEFEDLNAKIYGLNMYMGDIVPHFEQVGQNSYKANVVPSACVIDTMRFRVEFFSGEKAVDFHFDFDMKR